ncbi:putative O-glycosylation ligase, exosortase A system-associated [Candidatus Nitrotoga sp. M5]|uniref:putative O-glycosylation ligase, exosortase A system-associated n=1 Tax=Candidatus Nitrotoga sp. M5 TaxID=2890409 RepID=UPI001EF1EF01|nr:putative O-glycosylation ligase, exosortase A system-associated [Candidatus Nitrotoga sp. M5]CAH1385710.1 O-antigen polymerase [Candidatus Nitrotoga sp. M5]
MRDLFVTLVVFGLIPMALSRPYVGLYLYSWLSYMNPHRLAWGFATSMPFAYIVAITTIVSVFTSKEPKRMPWTREMTVLSMYIVWMLVTTYFALYSNLASEQLLKVIKIQIMIFLTPLVITNRQRLNGLIWTITLSLGFYGIKGGIFTILKGGAFRVQGPPGTFIAGNNEMALALLMTIPLIRYLHLQETRKWLKQGLGAAMVLTIIATIGSQSRGALVGATVMGFIFWMKSRNKFFTSVMITAAIGIVALVMPQEWYDRMSTIQTYDQDASALGRINAWWTAWNVANARVTGGGFEMFQYQTFHAYAPEPFRVHDVHSVYFEVLGEHGFIGLGLWLLLVLLTWRTGSWVIKNAKRDPGKKWAADLAAMGQVSMVGFGVAGAFLGLSNFDLFYHLLMIIILTKVILLKEEAQAISALNLSKVETQTNSELTTTR